MTLSKSEVNMSPDTLGGLIELIKENIRGATTKALSEERVTTLLKYLEEGIRSGAFQVAIYKQSYILIYMVDGTILTDVLLIRCGKPVGYKELIGLYDKVAKEEGADVIFIDMCGTSEDYIPIADRILVGNGYDRYPNNTYIKEVN